MKKVLFAMLSIAALSAYANTATARAYPPEHWYASHVYDGMVMELLPDDEEKLTITVSPLTNGKPSDVVTVDSCNRREYRVGPGESVICYADLYGSVFVHLTLLPEDFKNGSEGTYMEDKMDRRVG